MKGRFIIIFCLISLFYASLCEMTEEKRNYLLNRYTKKIDPLKSKIFAPLNAVYNREDFTYDPDEIKALIESNGFPESYNFIEDKNPPVNIKDQKSCGACWAFATTTALSYRYYLKGVNVDLSPQSLLSCYVQDCDEGGYILDANIYSSKNGVNTESCIPYSSSKGEVVDECPTKCKNSEEFIKYYAKNTYATDLDYDKDTYYDVVTLLIDQLVNFGPIAAGIIVYRDFYSLIGNSQCKNQIYKYDGTSASVGGHAVVIVGYGYENNKYYWLTQNSWGTNFCDNGFAKIEFGELEIENVAFSEPYIESESTSEGDISAKMTLQDDCRITYSTETNNYENFELNFDNDKSKENNNLYYQCGKDPKVKENSGICSFNYECLNAEKGYFTYKNSSMLRSNNKLTLDFSSFNQNQFYYYGADYIDVIYVETVPFYVSQSGSGITLLFSSFSGKDTNLVSKIYPNKDISTPFSNCKLTDIELDTDYYLLYCKLTQDDIDNIPQNNDLPIAYDILCGRKEKTTAYVLKLDTTKYPIYRIKEFILPFSDSVDGSDKITLIAEIEGSVSGLNGINENNYFVANANIYNNNKLTFVELECEIENPSSKKEDFEIYCFPYLEKRTKYDSIYLLPYYTPVESATPFEVIIDNSIKGTDDGEIYGYIAGSGSKFINYALSSLLLILFVLF